MNRRLLIVDRYEAPALGDLLADPARAAATDVLLLGLSHAWLRWRHGVTVPSPVDLVPLAPAAHGAVEQFVTETVATLPAHVVGGRPISDLFDSPDGNLWWYLDVSERGPYRGPLVQWLYRVAMARLAIDAERYEEVITQIADEPLAEAMSAPISADERERVHALPAGEVAWSGWGRRPLRRYLRHAVTAAVSALAVRAVSRMTGWPRLDVEAGGLASFTFYPAWWASPFSPAAADRFFSDLEGAGLSRYLAWLTSPAELWKRRRAVREALARHRMVVLQRFVSWATAWSNLRPREVGRVRRALGSLRGTIRSPFAGFDVGPMLERAIAESIGGGELCQDRLLAAAVRRATAAASPGAVVYRAEFQPSENALVRGLGRRARAVGFVHYPFGRRYLSMRFTPDERAAVGAPLGGAARPMPDGILACGEAGAGHVANAGYPAERVAVCGPQRHGRLAEYLRGARSPREELRRRLGLPTDRPVYLVALAILQADTEALFGALMEAQEALGPAFFVIRTHPNRPHGDEAMQATLAQLGRERAGLMPPGGDLYEYISAADAMVCIGSMIAFEAMALGVMPVVFENQATYAATSLAEYEEGLYVARTGAGLVSALTEAGRHDPTARSRRAAWAPTVTRTLGDLAAPLPALLCRALEAPAVAV